MNDSFLEDLDLVSSDVKNVYPVDRHVTTRTATSSPFLHVQKSKGENAYSKVAQSTHPDKQSAIRETKELRKMSEQDARKQQLKLRIGERKEKPVAETKLKPIENKVKSDGKEQEMKDEMKVKVKDPRVKGTENKVIVKERTRRSGSHKENTQAADVKENSRPSDPSKEGTSQVEAPREKTRAYEMSKKVEAKETDPTMLNTIREVVNVCTKRESTRILRAMQELHLNSQANLIKHLLSQTDDIVSEMHPSKDASRMRSLIELNERLQGDNTRLQQRNQELQKKLEELEHLKQENIALKLRCKELSRQ